MSQVLQNLITEQAERLLALEKTLVDQIKNSELEARLKKLEDKYFMLNARLTKYKVD